MPYKEDNPNVVGPAELSHGVWSQVPLLATSLVVTAAAPTDLQLSLKLPRSQNQIPHKALKYSWEPVS